MSEGFLLRVKYVKRGRLAALSHLETIRSMERIIRRAGLPYAISEGFNPHMKVSFGPALPVGAAGDGEYLDLRLTDYVDPQEALERMRATSVSDLQPIDCSYVPFGCEAATVAFPISQWRAIFQEERAAKVADAFEKLVEKGYIEVMGKAKKRKPAQVKQVSFQGRLVGGVEVAQEGPDVVVRFTTRAQAEGSLRPDRFIEAAQSDAGQTWALKSLCRTALLPEQLA